MFGMASGVWRELAAQNTADVQLLLLRCTPDPLEHCFPARMIPILTVAASCKSHATIRNALTVPCHAVLCCGMPCCAVPQPQVNTIVRTGKDGGPIEVMTVLSTKLCSASNVHSTPFQLIPLCLLCCAVLCCPAAPGRHRSAYW